MGMGTGMGMRLRNGDGDIMGMPYPGLCVVPALILVLQLVGPLGIEEYDVFSIVYEPVHGIIYTNSKKEKRVMRPSEIHKFCNATLRRTLKGLKSYYNIVKYGYVHKELINDEVEFLKLFVEEIEDRLNYRDQIRRWEMCVNGRPLGPRRERPE
ncbi:hypothetical protein Tco_1039438 [Tanacetum coccineum]